MPRPINAYEHPIAKLIAELQKLPPGTTYLELEGTFYGGQTVLENGDVLGTAYRLNCDIVLGIEAIAV